MGGVRILFCRDHPRAEQRARERRQRARERRGWTRTRESARRPRHMGVLRSARHAPCPSRSSRTCCRGPPWGCSPASASPGTQTVRTTAAVSAGHRMHAGQMHTPRACALAYRAHASTGHHRQDAGHTHTLRRRAPSHTGHTPSRTGHMHTQGRQPDRGSPWLFRALYRCKSAVHNYAYALFPKLSTPLEC